MSRVVLLGPWSEALPLGALVAELELEGHIAVITAGWQEWESDLDGMRSQLGDRIVPLRLYERAEAIWQEDPELREAHRSMQSDLRRIRELYSRQLDRAAEAWMELLDMEGPERLIGPERTAALDAIHRLDAHHLERIREVQAEYGERMRPAERPAVHRRREEVRSELAGCSAVVIEGGHAAVIHNRIGLFDLIDDLEGRTVIGRAAGAMVLCDRVVLYNDSPAIGRGNAEIGLPGFGLVPGLVAISDPSTRLRLNDVPRMRRLALRMAPARCALLDPGDRLDWDGSTLTGHGSSRVVKIDGKLEPWAEAA
ncbi:MAG: hypothetical protein HKN72_13080 [Gemmatimonadetes bacterium]|nr:hypothetical protein [Gemmatimonadota bacterium]